ncbi:MAG: cytidine deaminase [Firmicutes bacterium]|nr:cytidine deaminase [Bacillota bacterium]
MDIKAISENLYAKAEGARKNAYAPFSKFNVGAALLAVKDNSEKIYTGVNIENSSYGATICAERSAFACAISDGAINRGFEFAAIAISAGDEEAVPCGICRQFMLEFSPHIAVITKNNGVINIRSLDELMPMGFVLKPERDK